MADSFSISQFLEINKAINNIADCECFINRNGNISFVPSERFKFTIYNNGTIDEPLLFIRKYNIEYGEYSSAWILNYSHRTIHYFKTVKELIQYFNSYVNKDSNRLSERYYDFSWSNRYSSDKHWY